MHVSFLLILYGPFEILMDQTDLDSLSKPKKYTNRFLKYGSNPHEGGWGATLNCSCYIGSTLASIVQKNISGIIFENLAWFCSPETRNLKTFTSDDKQ